jgi:hypothetical protein
MAELKYRGRVITTADILSIQDLIAAHSQETCRPLSKKLYEVWQWGSLAERCAPWYAAVWCSCWIVLARSSCRWWSMCRTTRWRGEIAIAGGDRDDDKSKEACARFSRWRWFRRDTAETNVVSTTRWKSITIYRSEGRVFPAEMGPRLLASDSGSDPCKTISRTGFVTSKADLRQGYQWVACCPSIVPKFRVDRTSRSHRSFLTEIGSRSLGTRRSAVLPGIGYATMMSDVVVRTSPVDLCSYRAEADDSVGISRKKSHSRAARSWNPQWCRPVTRLPGRRLQ